MKMKRVLSGVLASVMIMSLVSCGSDNTTNTGSNANGEKEVVDSTEEITTVKISYPALVVVPSEEGTLQVEEAINEYLESKGENVRIDLDPIDGSNYVTQVDMAMIASENIDLYLPLTGLSGAVSSNKILPIDEYLDNELAGAVEVMGEEFLQNCVFDGKTYALPAYKGSVLMYYWVCDKEIFDATGFNTEDIKSVRDLEPVFAKIKELYPDRAVIAPALGVAGSGNTFSTLQILGGVDDYRASDLLNGTVVIGDDKTVQNLYTTDYFKEACDIAYSWNQKGYVLRDASVTTDAHYDLVAADRAASLTIAYAYEPNSVEDIMEKQCNKEVVAIPISESLLASSPLNWGISYTSKNPRAAAKVLNMLYTDEFVLNSLIFGLEDVSWVDSGKGDGSIVYPEGQTMETVPYTAALSCGILGNQFIMYALEGNTTVEDVAFMAEKMENAVYSPVFGFTTDVNNVKMQVSSISNIIKQYEGGLFTGELNPDEYIPKLIKELEGAGINELIAEAQTQLDAWDKERNNK